MDTTDAAVSSNFSNVGMDMFDDTSLWNRIFGEDLNEGVKFSGEINFEEAFSLFGLPWLGSRDTEDQVNQANTTIAGSLGF